MRRLDDGSCDTSIELDGHPTPAKTGEPVACSLLAAGETVFSRSIKYHRPRGPFCFTGSCAHCLMRIDGVPNLPTCQVTVKPGMRVERQNSFPSARLDLFSITDWVFPRGMNHHEMFAGVPIAEQVMAKVARQLAGLGTLPDKEPPRRLPAETLKVPVAIVGGGASGLAAAQTLEARGADYVLLERDEFLGGRLAAGIPEFGEPAVVAPPKQRVRLGFTAVGLFEDAEGRFLAGVQNDRLYKIYATQVLLAMGGHPQLLAFENNDLPGIFAARAVARMIRRFRFLPGKRIAVVGEPQECQALAKLITENKGEALAVGSAPIRAHGVQELSALTVKRGESEVKFDCDAVALCAPVAPSFELARQGGARVRWNAQAQVFTVETDSEGKTNGPSLFVAGELLGPLSASAAAESGRRAAAAMLGVGS